MAFTEIAEIAEIAPAISFWSLSRIFCCTFVVCIFLAILIVG